MFCTHTKPAKIWAIKESPIKSYFRTFKVEKILKGSLDSIPSPLPSVKIQIMDGKICLRHKGKTLLGIVNEKEKDCWHNPGMFCFITSSKFSRQ